MCPGRHFASTEILAFAALMIAQFDFEPVKGSWVTSKTEKAGAHATVAPPDTDVEVRISPVTGELSDKSWAAILSGLVESAELSVEDAQVT